MFLSLGTSTNSAGPVENRQRLFRITKIRHNCKKAHKFDRYIKKKKKIPMKEEAILISMVILFLLFLILFIYLFCWVIMRGEGDKIPSHIVRAEDSR